MGCSIFRERIQSNEINQNVWSDFFLPATLKSVINTIAGVIERLILVRISWNIFLPLIIILLDVNYFDTHYD